MNDQLKPCPACAGNRADHAHSHGGQYSVICPDCYMLGPRHKTVDAANTAWNALPRALVWTTEPPKVEGNYWWTCEEEQIIRGWEPHPAIVHVRTVGGKFHFTFHYGNGPFFHCCDQCRWSGPIPEPQESRP